jgi:ribosomal protein S18 acetylase RimI-like enzyme
MRTINVRGAEARDKETVISTLLMAFSSDPAARWVYPGADGYFKHFSDFISKFGGKAFAHGSVHRTEDGRAAALWLPPGVEPDGDEVMALLERTAPRPVWNEAAEVFEQMGRYHPEEPHWYLPMIGVDVTAQGQGYGSALLKYALKACDRDGTDAYLESSNPRNVPLYERHGFDLCGTIQVGSSPPIFPMIRKARAGRRLRASSAGTP